MTGEPERSEQEFLDAVQPFADLVAGAQATQNERRETTHQLLARHMRIELSEAEALHMVKSLATIILTNMPQERVSVATAAVAGFTLGLEVGTARAATDAFIESIQLPPDPLEET